MSEPSPIHNTTEIPKNTLPVISIIVPIYNVAKYLREALESIKTQTFENWECIIVNDGSTDGSEEIALEFVNADNRFRIINQENSGVSKARNTGLEASRGKFIAFVDADDWIDKNYLSYLHSLIEKYSADVAQCGYRKEFRDMSIKKQLVKEELILPIHDAMPLFLKSQMPTLLWSKLYRKSMITEKFPEGQTFEDTYTMPVWFKNAKKVVLSPEILYHYRMRRSGITKIGLAENHYDCIKASCRLGNIVYETVPDQLDKKHLASYIHKVNIAGAKTIARKEKDIEKRLEVIKRIGKELKEEDVPPVSYLGLKSYLRSYLLRNHPNTFMKLMRGVNKFDFHAKLKKNNLYD